MQNDGVQIPQIKGLHLHPWCCQFYRENAEILSCYGKLKLLIEDLWHFTRRDNPTVFFSYSHGSQSSCWRASHTISTFLASPLAKMEMCVSASSWILLGDLAFILLR